MWMQKVSAFVCGGLGGAGGVLLARHLLPDSSDENRDQSKTKDESRNSVASILKYGVPSAGMRTLLEYENHVLEYDPVRRVPKWVAEHVSKEKAFGESANRKLSRFDRDPLVPPPFAAENKDFWKSGWSRGHMAPAGNNKHSQSAMNQTFFLTNIVPQDMDNNGNFWNRLEIYCRELTKEYSDVYIISGPLWLPESQPMDVESQTAKDDETQSTRVEALDRSVKDRLSVVNVQNKTETAKKEVSQVSVEGEKEAKPRKVKPPRPPKKFVKYEVIGRNNIAVPTHLFKIILVEDASMDRPMMSSFIIPNRPVEDVKLENFETDLAEVERHVGVRFHQDLDPANVDRLCLKTGCRLNNYREFQQFFWTRRLSSPWNLYNLEKDWKELNKKGFKSKELEDMYLIKKKELVEKERTKIETAQLQRESNSNLDPSARLNPTSSPEIKVQTLPPSGKPGFSAPSTTTDHVNGPPELTAAAG